MPLPCQVQDEILAESAGDTGMTEPESGIIVAVLGQWASGKTTAAKTLVRHLGGRDKVEFLTDRVLFAGQVANHILELEESKVKVSIEDDGRQRLEGELATVWLHPGEDLRTVDASTLDFWVYDEEVMNSWRMKAKVELGRQIRKRSVAGKPIVIETAFGPNLEPEGEDPYGRTISDHFERLSRTGVELRQVKWILVEASFDKRRKRNAKRGDGIPAYFFDRLGADGGDLTPDQQSRLEEQGVVIKRVPNEHDDVDRFKADVIAAFEEMFGDV
jgi:hypothetical protein